MSWSDRIERWFLGHRYKAASLEEHKKFREAVHEGRNIAMMALNSVREAHRSSDRAYETARRVIERLEKSNET
jgi:hypothetical protein